MTSRLLASVLAAHVAAAALVLTAPLALAAPAVRKAPAGPQAPQSQASQPLKPDVIAVGDWAVRCFPIKAPAPCDLFQQDMDSAAKRRVTSISIAYAPGKDLYAAQIVVPLGVALDKRLVIKAGPYQTQPMAFRRCERDGCYVETRLEGQVIDALAAEPKQAELMVTSIDGKPYRFPISLKGFPEAEAKMKALAAQKASSN